MTKYNQTQIDKDYRDLHTVDLTVYETLRAQFLTISGQPIEATTLVVAADDAADLNGEKLIIDADQDTYIRQTGGPAGTDDSVDIFVAGAADFRIVANILRALSGSSIETNTLNETTAASGVTIDGALVKDGGIVLADGATLEGDTINEATANAGVTIDGVLIKDNFITAARKDFVITAVGSLLAAADSGKTYLVTGADQTFTLPATVEGLEYTFILAAAGLSAGTGLSISPNAADAIHGAGLTSVDDKDLILAGGGDAEGDTVTIRADGVDGWYITSVFGTWSKQA